MTNQEIIKKIKEHNEKDKVTFVGKVIRINPKDNYEYVEFVTYNDQDEVIFVSFSDNRLKGKFSIGDFIEIRGKLIKKDKTWKDKKTGEERQGKELLLKYVSKYKIVEKFSQLDIE